MHRVLQHLGLPAGNPCQEGLRPTDLPRWMVLRNQARRTTHRGSAVPALLEVRPPHRRLSKQLFCPICSGPHEQKEHRQHAGCCKGNAKAKPPVPPTPRDQPCPHKGRCVNCHKDHTTNSALCKFWAHRYDREWIMAKYRQVHEHAARRQLTNPRT
ncbi:unnamed protein product [Cyclocybe aegerita]|uniref:Uncharacterized protein n=1 Tax=Cyclocybe aegerita TaxID=1973307 RepID=A0A8S0VT35_CYCAE|nr:unnamed protein product [Cyclocybe aegerita]